MIDKKVQEKKPDKTRPLILGVSSSLRSGRWGMGTNILMDQLRKIDSENELKEFLKNESEKHLENFIESGRQEGLPFDQIFKKLKKTGGRTGLSNSEVILSSALWSVYQAGCEIELLSLADVFPHWGEAKNLDLVKETVLRADALLISTPVYFGDRSSLANDFIDFLYKDTKLRNSAREKVYAGLSVGAKRNGGQETTLIYQILDMVNLNFLSVGNDSETTSQYGGTCVAGDIGTAWKDEYGLWTSMGTGRRLARVTQLVNKAKQGELKGKIKVGFFITQDENKTAFNFINDLVKKYSNKIDSKVFIINDKKIYSCIACDVCPTHIGEDSEYRCIVKTKDDWFVKNHTELLDLDALVPVTFASDNKNGLESVYQKFNERTRYLRRGDYLFSDLVVAPISIEEMGSHSSQKLRMMTSMIRHHTVMTQPLVTYLDRGKIIKMDSFYDKWELFLSQAKILTVGRLIDSQEFSPTSYVPKGYILSHAKELEDEKLNKRIEVVRAKKKHQLLNFKRRIIPNV